MNVGPRRGFRPMRDLPAMLWLLAIPVVALLRPLLPAPHWLLLHLLLLGAVSHSILVWSRHFAEAVLHSASDEADLTHQSQRQVLLNLGVLGVLTGVTGGWWPLTATGALAVATAAVWHGLSLHRLLRRSLSGRFSVTVRYYVAAACFLPVGAALGTVLARGHERARHEQEMVAHVAVNLFGWVGLTVIGTLLTLWPTLLRTRMTEGSERATRRALPVLVVAVMGTATAALAGSRPLTGLGLGAYLVGLAVVARPFAATARRKRPSSYPTWSVLSGVLWFTGALLTAAVGIATADSWPEAGERFSSIAPFLAAGFAAQTLLGALSFLVPSVLGGGPAQARAGHAVMNRAGNVRVLVVNISLLVSALPVPGQVRLTAQALTLTGLTSTVLLLLVVAARRARREPQAGGRQDDRHAPPAQADAPP